VNYKFYRKVNDDGTVPGGSDIRDAIKSFFGRDIEIIIRKKTKQRTNEQNRLFWSYMNILGFDLGYTKDEMHDLVCAKFLAPVEMVIEQTGEVISSTRGTKDLTTKEFTTLIEDILDWATEDLGSNLPLPNQQVEIEL